MAPGLKCQNRLPCSYTYAQAMDERVDPAVSFPARVERLTRSFPFAVLGLYY